MELKEGMYVRTKKGTIDKLNNENITRYLVAMMGFNEKPIKASYVLGEVLEVGDFIDIHYIYEIKGTTIITYSGWFIDFEDIEDCVEKILTKEQFESMSYKL